MPGGFDTSRRNQGCTIITNNNTSSISRYWITSPRFTNRKGNQMKKTMIEKARQFIV
jgi:hypothetical protein